MSNRTGSDAGTTRILGTAAMVTYPVQQILVFAFLLLQPSRPLSDMDSLYALGAWGWLWRAGAIVTGVGIVLLAVGLSRSFAPGKRVRLVITTMTLGGLAVIGTGVFPTDAPLDDGTVGYTTSGVLHFLFGIVAFLALLVTVFVLRAVFRRDPRWSFAARPTAWLAWWLLAGVVLVFAIPEGTTAAGVVQRFVFIPNAVWGVWLAWSLRRIGSKVNEETTGRRSEVGNR